MVGPFPQELGMEREDKDELIAKYRDKVSARPGVSPPVADEKLCN